jgi:coenzyme F420-0:L-glutamate ligase/coenzyme F420-1:gamma-L-glutamate ligase
MTINLQAIPDLPEITEGDDIAEIIAGAANGFKDGDIVVIAQKIVSKAEGRAVALAGVEPGDEALALAAKTEKDPRLVQLILDESDEVMRSRPGVIITSTRQGFVCANAGIDASNVPGDETVLLLPVDSDESARQIRAKINKRTAVNVAVVITDSFGRAWRVGQQDIALGCAGIEPVNDLRGQRDSEGRELLASVAATVDEIASAANLARGKTSHEPVVVLRGLGYLVTTEDGPGALALLRERNEDFFR